GALRAHPGVANVAVLDQAASGASRRLVAFLAFGSGFEPTVTELRSWLKDRLPADRVPASFVVLDTLPVAPDGTVDRDRLAAVDPGRPAPASDAGGPRTAMEALLAEVWREALGLEHVPLHANFYDLGGHSLLAVRVIAQIEKKTGVRLDPRDVIFQTLAQLAAACEERTRGGRAVLAARP